MRALSSESAATLAIYAIHQAILLTVDVHRPSFISRLMSRVRSSPNVKSCKASSRWRWSCARHRISRRLISKGRFFAVFSRLISRGLGLSPHLRGASFTKHHLAPHLEGAPLYERFLATYREDGVTFAKRASCYEPYPAYPFIIPYPI